MSRGTESSSDPKVIEEVLGEFYRTKLTVEEARTDGLIDNSVDAIMAFTGYTRSIVCKVIDNDLSKKEEKLNLKQ